MGSPPRTSPRLPAGASRAERLERLAWRVGLRFEAHGVRIGVRSNDPRVIQRLPPLLPPGSRPLTSGAVDEVFSVWVRPRADRVARRVRLYAGGSPFGQARGLGRALPGLESALRLKVAAASTERVFVHAGVVAWRGRAILLPGRSRSGKSTLVRELLRAGATYLSDEFAPLDRDGRVHPFAKPLTLRADGDELHPRRLPAGRLGAPVSRGALRVGLVAFTEFLPGARWRPVPLTRGQAVLAALAHTVPARLRPEAALATLDRALADARLLSGPRGEAALTAGALVERVNEGLALPGELP